MPIYWKREGFVKPNFLPSWREHLGGGQWSNVPLKEKNPRGFPPGGFVLRVETACRI